MVFCFPKAYGGVGACLLLFLFANNIAFSLSVDRPDVRPTDLRLAALLSVAFPADLMLGEKALNCWVYPVNVWYIMLYIFNFFSTKAYCTTNGCEKKRQGQNHVPLLLLFISHCVLLTVCWGCILLYINTFLLFNNSKEYQSISISPFVTV